MTLSRKQLLNLFGRMSDGMIAIDALSRIVAWNQAAVDLFGYTTEEVVDRCCADVLQWRDRNLKLICGPECKIRVQAAKGLIGETRSVIATAKSGRSVRLEVSTMVLPREHHRACRMVHFVRQAGPPGERGPTELQPGRGVTGELQGGQPKLFRFHGDARLACRRTRQELPHHLGRGGRIVEPKAPLPATRVASGSRVGRPQRCFADENEAVGYTRWLPRPSW